MNRTIARLSALLVTGACVSGACGGKVVVDVVGDAGSTSSSGGGAMASSSSSSSSSSGGGAGGGCDAASHTIDYKNYDLSCTVDSDCIPAFLGNLCSKCTCPLATINVADKMKYLAETQAKAVPPSPGGPGGCFCPGNHPICANGQCTPQVP
jgi:hypothetical protein